MLDMQATAARPATRLPIIWAALSRGRHMNEIAFLHVIISLHLSWGTSTHKLQAGASARIPRKGTGFLSCAEIRVPGNRTGSLPGAGPMQAMPPRHTPELLGPPGSRGPAQPWPCGAAASRPGPSTLSLCRRLPSSPPAHAPQRSSPETLQMMQSMTLRFQQSAEHALRLGDTLQIALLMA